MDSEKKLFMMAFKRDSVIALHLAGKPQVAIVRALNHYYYYDLIDFNCSH